MNEQNFISFVFGAFTLFVGILIQPQIQRLINGFKRILTRIKPKSHKASTNDCDAIKTQLDALERYAKQKEYNTRAFIRREVKQYLIELQNGK